VSKLRLKYLHPDYAGLRDTVAKALAPKPAGTPSSTPTAKTTIPGKSATPRKSTTPGKSATPPPTENLTDACAYHPSGPAGN
jgi:hypothetical protein